MSVFDTFSRIEIYALAANEYRQPLVDALETLKNELRPEARKWHRSSGSESISVNFVCPELIDGRNIIRSVVATIGGGMEIVGITKSAIHLSGILASAPVSFDWDGMGRVITVTAESNPSEVVNRFYAEYWGYKATPSDHKVKPLDEAIKSLKASIRRGKYDASSLLKSNP